jgi:hypothetical protein
MKYWHVPTGELRLAAAKHTISHMRAQEQAAPKFDPNRASRRFMKKKYGREVPQWKWNPKLSAKSGAALADLVNALATAGNDWATRYGLRRKIEAIEPQIRSAIASRPTAHGALLVAKYIEWEQRDFTGARAKTALSAAIASPGITPVDAFARWVQINTTTGVISAGAPKGWVAHELYFWAVV